jgi:carbonic anhydrase/acetyltransferase-like protein (isoleucine patch superfamily)
MSTLLVGIFRRRPGAKQFKAFAIDFIFFGSHDFRMNLQERLCRFLHSKPTIHPTAFVAPGADVIGHVTLAEESSVWFQTVLRGDINRIVIGPRSNVQDGSVIHLADDFGTHVGELVTVGHKAVLHACTVADEVLIGMGAIILDGAEIGARSIIGAGALVTGGRKIPAGSLVLGSPAKVVRTLSMEEQSEIRTWAEKYVALARAYRERAGG